MTIRMLAAYPYGRHTIPAGAVVSVFDAATETGLIGAKLALAASGVADTWTVPIDVPSMPTEVSALKVVSTSLTPAAQGVGGGALCRTSAGAVVISSADGQSWSSVSGDGGVLAADAAPMIPSELRATLPPATWLTWVQRHEQVLTGATHTQRHDVWVPVSTDGLYAMYTFATSSASATVAKQLAQINLGRIGRQTHHSAGTGVTKTGSWTTTSSLPFPGGSGCYATTAGAAIEFAITGHAAVLRTTVTTNGGFAVVAVDGDWTAANRLPTFTQADADAGRCRAVDVGRRYVRLQGYTQISFLDLPLFEGLADTAHTVRIEATGTWPSGGSAGRTYLASIVGCSAADVGQSLSSGSSRWVAQVECGLSSQPTFPVTACAPVVAIERAATPGTYDFVGDVHGLETPVSFAVFQAEADVTATLVAGAPVSATSVTVSVVSTVARTDDTATPVIRRSHDYVLSAGGAIPCALSWRWDVLTATRANQLYPLMLLPWELSQASSATTNGRWTGVKFGTYSSTAADWVAPSSVYQSSGTLLGRFDGADHQRTLYAAMLDGGAAAEYFAGAGARPVFWQSNTRKLYWSRVIQSVRALSVGQVLSGSVGWGIVDRAAPRT